MDFGTRHRVWYLLSDLFVDTELTDEQLCRIGVALKQTGLSSNDVEKILRREVAPVCGAWMRWPSIGPWPAFEPEWVKESIERYLSRPALFRLGLWSYPGVRRSWKIVRAEMEK